MNGIQLGGQQVRAWVFADGGADLLEGIDNFGSILLTYRFTDRPVELAEKVRLTYLSDDVRLEVECQVADVVLDFRWDDADIRATITLRAISRPVIL